MLIILPDACVVCDDFSTSTYFTSLNLKIFDKGISHIVLVSLVLYTFI